MKNFFEHQDEARQNTAKLGALFALSVVSIIAGLYLAMVGVLAYAGDAPLRLWQPGLFAVTTAGGLLVIGMGSLTKTWALREGGSAVAEELGGKLLDREPENFNERQVQNVVEEMAIASGTPVPEVYLLADEDAINAFAAGYTPDDAVIGVTKGCVERLNRDELQGVIAHEFSHILNGDMRINIRLIGLLHGILLIGILGRIMMHSTVMGGRRRSRSSNGRGRLVAVLLGLALFVIGSAGFFCGRLIKSAVSRQREFLADASAVQFTRNPDGIAGALKKIGGFAEGAQLRTSKAEEASHLFFGDALQRRFLGGALATHPPLKERIQRIDPSFDGTFAEGEAVEASTVPEGASGLAGAAAKSRSEARSAEDRVRVDPEHVVEQAGTLTAEHISYGRDVREAVPETVRRAVHEPFGAMAVVYGLVLDADPDLRGQQWTVLRERSVEGVVEELEGLLPELERLDRRVRLPLVEMAAPALRELSPGQYHDFAETLHRFIEADERLSIFEYALEKIVQRRLATAFSEESEPRRARHRRISDVVQDAVMLLSALARVGHSSNVEVKRAFEAGMARFDDLDPEERASFEPSTCSPQDMDRALGRLLHARLDIKRQVIDACAHCVLADREVTVQEAELLRAVAIAMDCPMPPLLHSEPEEVSTAQKR